MADDLILQPLTFDQCVQVMRDRLAIYQYLYDLPVTDLLEGSQTLGLFEAIAGPLEELFVRLGVDLPKKFFLDEATGDALDRLVSSFTFGQVLRIPASKAAGALVVLGAPGSVFPVGSRFRTTGGLVVETLQAGAINIGDTQTTVPAVALLEGVAGNLPLNTTLTCEPAVTGITGARIDVAWTGGADLQSDDDLRQAVIEWLDSLARATVPALIVGAQAGGYTHAFVTEPFSRVVVYVDDGGPVSQTKLDACQFVLVRAWKAAGARLRVRARVEKPITIEAEAFGSVTATKAALEAAIAAKWAGLFSTKRMGQGVTRLELLAAAATVPGYNGVNLELPDQLVKPVLDEYSTEFGAGELFPYELPVLAGIVWS
jgi:uncharacterized phage protein gp47/JayE